MGAGGVDVRVVRHEDLEARDRAGLQRVFDGEYRDAFGPWTPERPYGYAGHDVHVIAWAGDDAVGHVGWGRRVIRVARRPVVIAGVGGVLVAPAGRGSGLGQRLMDAAVESMRQSPARAPDGCGGPGAIEFDTTDLGRIEFGYLGCREEVAPFYASCGWTRLVVRERFVDRLTGEARVQGPGPPIFIRGVGLPVEAWPDDDVDLCGPPW